MWLMRIRGIFYALTAGAPPPSCGIGQCRMYHANSAEEMLHGELAVALGMTREQVPQFISDALGDAGEPEAALA